jgi:hypothetical protein
LVSWVLFSGFNKVSTVPSGKFSKASLVGANTVNGPLPYRVSTRPAAFIAATKVVWSLEFAAFSTMFFCGYIPSPPTITVLAALFIAISCAKTCLELNAARANVQLYNIIVSDLEEKKYQYK